MKYCVLFTAMCCMIIARSAISICAEEPRKKAPPRVIPISSPEDRRILAILEQRTNCELEDAPFQEAIEAIGKEHNIRIILDRNQMAVAKIPLDTPVHLERENVRVHDLLDGLLAPLNLTFYVKSEVVIVTTIEDELKTYFARVYPVNDLAADAEGLTALMDAMKVATVNAVWSDTDGGAITTIPARQVIVVRQTRRHHEQIERLLYFLRDVE